MIVKFFTDYLKDGCIIVEWREDGFRLDMADSGNRRPGLVNDKGSTHFITWSNWEIAL